jgi:two-component system sensor histidine kinase UhpB
MRNLGKERATKFKRGGYRQLVDSAHAILWMATLQFQCTFVSKEAESILGYPVEQWVSEPTFWRDHIHPEDRERAVAFSAQSMLERKPFDFEYRMIAKDGSVVWFRDFVRVLSQDDQPNELIGVMIDITRQKNAEEQLTRSLNNLRALSAHLQAVREEERAKIARELHDDLGQMLTALQIDLSLLSQKLSEPSASVHPQKLIQEIDAMCSMADQTIQSLHRIATELRPAVLDHLDLKEALEWQAFEFQAHSKIECDFVSNVKTIDMDRDSATALFRIVQETLSNVEWHSRATRVAIKLEEEDNHLTIEISDNGRGIVEEEIADRKSLGLLGIKERAALLGGDLSISGVPGQGTRVRVRVLLKRKTASEHSDAESTDRG